MKHTSNWTSLHGSILSFISQSEVTSAKYLKLWHIGIRGLTELGMDVTESPKTRRLPVVANKTVELPNDYLQWVKIGVLNDKGEVATLRHNSSLTSYGAIDDERLSINTGNILTKQYFRNYQEGDCYFNLYGVPAGTQNIGEFKVDDVQGLILLDNDFAYDSIILEYLASPVSDKDFLFPIQARECIIAWLGWKDIESMPQGRRSNGQMIQMRKSEYYRLKKRASMRLNPFRISDANQIIRINNRLTLKA